MTNTYVSNTPRSLLQLASNAEHKGTEHKFYPALDGNASLSTTFTFYTPNLVSTGTNINQRVGRIVRITGCSIVGWFTPADAYQSIRLIVGLRPNGYIAAPNITTGNTYYSGPAETDEKIVYCGDHLIGFPAASYSGATTYPTVPVAKYYRFGKKGVECRWNVAGSISNNCPFVAIASDSIAATHPGFVGTIRFYFDDT